MLFGRPGCGKSTFAVEIGERLSLPVYHVDKIFFESHWQLRQRESFLVLKQAWIDQDKWVIDGNAMSTLETRFAHAHVAIYFNFPWYICLWRILKRLWAPRDFRIDDRAPHSPERVTWGLVRYMLCFRKRYSHKIYTLARSYPTAHFIEVTNDKQVFKLAQKLLSDKHAF
jgi:adenylate kinase family enzyme